MVSQGLTLRMDVVTDFHSPTSTSGTNKRTKNIYVDTELMPPASTGFLVSPHNFGPKRVDYPQQNAVIISEDRTSQGMRAAATPFGGSLGPPMGTEGHALPLRTAPARGSAVRCCRSRCVLTSAFSRPRCVITGRPSGEKELEARLVYRFPSTPGPTRGRPPAGERPLLHTCSLAWHASFFREPRL